MNALYSLKWQYNLQGGFGRVSETGPGVVGGAGGGVVISIIVIGGGVVLGGIVVNCIIVHGGGDGAWVRGAAERADWAAAVGVDTFADWLFANFDDPVTRRYSAINDNITWQRVGSPDLWMRKSLLTSKL